MTSLSRIAAAILATSAAAFLCTAPAAAQTAPRTLYDRLGGKEALGAVVGELWSVVAADARINRHFARTRPEAFAGQLVDFLCQASGGPCQYKGKDMLAAHTGMQLTDGDFTALAEDTALVLDRFKVPAQEKGEVMNMLGGLKPAVVGR
ncbi:group I truncated hemoglobin [Ramlibacter sp. AN1133]|uniref:group I truncated hemoglobin n=1 Tax=Ramlibacter sp. AN1133 TaxID=3133429 RepID=UPI0030C3F3DC